MPQPKLPLKVLTETLQTLQDQHGNIAETAKILGLPRGTIDSRVSIAKRDGLLTAEDLAAWREGLEFVVQKPLDPETPIEELLQRKERSWKRRKAAFESSRLLPVTVNAKGPIGIALVGDLHIDDDGCDWETVQEHLRLIKETDGLFAISLGDLQNAWVGKLIRLYAEQEIKALEAWRLLEWWLDEIGEKLIAVTLGNHDMWARGVNGTSPPEWMLASRNTICKADQARLGIQANGKEYIIHCRHDFPGRSIYNPAHGPLRAAKLDGWAATDDVLVCGHIHTTGYFPLMHAPSQRVCHALRVGSYKKIDAHAQGLGFPESDFSECPLLILDPREPDERYRVQVEFKLERGVRWLNKLREDWKNDHR